jgi:cell division protein FtsB
MNNMKHPTLRLIVIAICAFVSLGFIRSLWDTWRGGDQISERRVVLNQEQKQHDQLIRQLEEATSSAFIEREARNKLGLVKDGETIILMTTPAVGEDQAQNTQQPSLSRWQQWWGLFF